ncbi:Cupredoxin [Bisporella sp. PMI_857]|nr:Cupredoxin [Bisporella sp. PMI_857]
MYTYTLLVSLLPAVLAQYGGSSGSSSSTSAAAASTTASATKGIQTVLVGSPQTLVFSPNSIKADVGTVVEFVFYPNTHSVAQSSFAEPCEPLANGTGFYSGRQTTASGSTGANVFAITINDTKPIWYYCAFPSHCKSGMVGVINPPSDGSKTVAQFISAAAEINETVAPTVVQGGFVGPASAVSVPSSNSTGNAGVESRGSVQWGLLGMTAMMAAGFGGLII